MATSSTSSSISEEEHVLPFNPTIGLTPQMMSLIGYVLQIVKLYDLNTRTFSKNFAEYCDSIATNFTGLSKSDLYLNWKDAHKQLILTTTELLKNKGTMQNSDYIKIICCTDTINFSACITNLITTMSCITAYKKAEGHTHKICKICNTTQSTFKLCSECRMVRYCSVECQRQDWINGHKAKCAELKKSKNACAQMVANLSILLIESE
jgi:hypothetical protein